MVISEREKHFLFLVDKHKGILYKIARMYMNTEEGQKDLQQEIIIQLWNSYQSFRGESEFSTWMYRVSVNTAITFSRREKKQSDIFLSQEVPDKPASEYDGRLDRQMELFYQAVHQLKPVEKAIIFYLLEGMTYREIGQNLGISEGNARVKLNRAKEKLQNLLKDKVYEL